MVTNISDTPASLQLDTTSDITSLYKHMGYARRASKNQTEADGSERFLRKNTACDSDCAATLKGIHLTDSCYLSKYSKLKLTKLD